MRQEVDRDGALQAAPILPDAAEDRGATLLSEVSKYLDLSEVARYVEQMSSEESEGPLAGAGQPDVAQGGDLSRPASSPAAPCTYRIVRGEGGSGKSGAISRRRRRAAGERYLPRRVNTP